ncbi:MAG: DUF4252 domain-containing protein [Alistipes sp.]|nr:DUF4252 domain-containing protein [Alistipes sp.]
MKRYILFAIMLLVTTAAHAELPQIAALGKQASKQKDVEHMSVGSFMLGMAETFAEKEQRATFKMLDNIEIIESQNTTYAPTLVARAKSIAEEVGAEYIGGKDDGKALNELYGIKKGDIVTELIIITRNHTGEASVVVMSGNISLSRLAEIEKIKR